MQEEDLDGEEGRVKHTVLQKDQKYLVWGKGSSQEPRQRQKSKLTLWGKKKMGGAHCNVMVPVPLVQNAKINNIEVNSNSKTYVIGLKLRGHRNMSYMPSLHSGIYFKERPSFSYFRNVCLSSHVPLD